MSHTGDELMGAATRVAAAWLDALGREGVAIGERAHLEPIARLTLAKLQDEPVDETAPKVTLPNWDRKLGGFDVAVRRPDGRPHFLAELKVEKMDETLWDAYKMIDALWLDGVEGAYLILAVSDDGRQSLDPRCPAGGRRAAELFRGGEWTEPSFDLFQGSAHAWYELLWGGTARPRRIPAEVRITEIESPLLPIGSKSGSLRCVRVEPDGEAWLEFSPDWYGGEWPVGVQPCQHYLDWRGIDRQ